METLKFKVGDIVKVMPTSWYDFFKNKSGNVFPNDVGIENGRYYFSKEMARKCGVFLEIIEVVDNGYKVRGMNEIFEDWMLENEAVTEEKQEVEQLNKIEMETKKMTLQEAQELVKNTKYIVFTEDESRQLQKKLFELGCGWFCGGPIVSHTEHPYLFVDEELKITYTQKNDYKYFENSCHKFQLKDDIFNIKIKEQPKPKFDPNNLKPFDKVLVRQNEKSIWLARFYEYKDDVEFHVTNGGAWQYCIPYNDETKHLHRTNNEAPEFYKLD